MPADELSNEKRLETVERRRPGRMVDTAIVVVLVVIAATGALLAASSQALPDNPAYELRLAGEQIRLVVADRLGREQLRIQFARDRFRQAQQVGLKNPSEATRLIDDGSVYLDKAWRDLPSLTAADQAQVLELLTQADEDQEDAQVLLN